MSQRYFLSFLICLFCLSLRAEDSSNPQPAQGEKTVKSDPAQKPTTLPAVTVVGEREREEQKPVTPPATATEPVSATVITREQIEHANIDDTKQVGPYVPNLSIHDIGDRRTQVSSIRGLVNSNFGDPTVGLYVDDVPIADWRAFDIELFDIERIEVLRGPQVTRFGRGAEAGMINVVTQQPSGKYEGQATFKYGNYNTQLYRASVSGPILKDKLLFRLSGLESKRDGYLKNEFDGSRPDFRDNLAGRAELQFAPVPELKMTLSLDGQLARDGAQTYVLLSRPDLFKVDNNTKGREDTHSEGVALKNVYEAPGFELTSITSSRDWTTNHSIADVDFTPQNLLAFKDDYQFVQWSQELRVASAGTPGCWKWFTGVYFEDKQTDVNVASQALDTTNIQAPPPAGLGLPFTAPIQDHRLAHLYDRTIAVFGETTYTAWDKLDATFGLRYENNFNSIRRRRELEAPMENLVLTAAPFLNAQTESNVVLPKFELAYRVEPSLTVYSTVAEGYRPGGFSHLTIDPKLAEWKPDFLWNYEAGLKGNWLNQRVECDLALFYDPVRDYQDRRQEGSGQLGVENASRASTRGFETDIVGRPLQGLELVTGFGYNDARYDKFHDQVTGQNFDGHTILLASKYNFSLSAQYLHSTGFLIRSEYQGVGRYPFQEDNFKKQAAYQLFNQKIGYETKHYGIYIYGKNLLDVHYSHLGFPNFVGPGLVGSPGDPRTFGVMGTLKF